MKLRTTCDCEIWSGFFGINENGDQPECGHEFEIDVDEESILIDEDGNPYPCFEVECPKCHHAFEGAYQQWEVVDEVTP